MKGGSENYGVRVGKSVILTATSFVLLGGLAFYHSSYSESRKNIPFSSETSHRIVSGEALFAETFSDVKGLVEKADLIAEAEVVSQETYPEYEILSVHTISQLKLNEVYKGDKKVDDIISVLETGGEYDEREAAKYIPDGKPGSDLEQELGIIEEGIEGSVPMKKGNKYFVFLKKNNKQGNYNVAGAVQGKIKITNKGELVSQISPETIEHGKKHDDLYFLQEEYSGRPISELIHAVKRELNENLLE